MKDELVLAFAEAALARGDYRQCLIALEGLAHKYPLNSHKDSKLKMLMITALIGQGDQEKAVLICRQLTHSKDNEIRQVSKQLLSVLESPRLGRPDNWSIQLPSLDLDPSTGSNFYKTKEAREKQPEEKAPLTGPTRDLSLGFSSLVLVILISLTIFLSGCVQIITDIEVQGPDQIQLNWEIKSISKQLLPWQVEFERSIQESRIKVKVNTTSEGQQKIQTKTLRSDEASMVVQEIFSTAAKTAGVKIPPPTLSLKEKNWIIGVQQELHLTVDLEEIPQIPDLKLLARIHKAKNKDMLGKPLATSQVGTNVNWQIKQGELNSIEFHQWRWNKLGIGTVLVIILFVLNLILQRIRLKMGFGFPELPP